VAISRSGSPAFGIQRRIPYQNLTLPTSKRRGRRRGWGLRFRLCGRLTN